MRAATHTTATHTTASCTPNPPKARPAPARPISGQILAFALVGVVNTATYYGLYLLFLMRLPYLAAHLLAFALSMTGSFFLNARFTYRTRPTWRKFLLFPLTNATSFLITTAGVYLMAGVLHAGHRLAPLLASGAAVPVTFAVSRTIMLRGAATAGAKGTPEGTRLESDAR
ncbi:GtrA family protein [Streptomyces bluensis]|uniref:GtrA family protein n=1 Tax=Streptomyces bluensis TaxID=33897 RepID=UPI0016759297|nr:GtrA family protein [Streptomyces bluensis]